MMGGSHAVVRVLVEAQGVEDVMGILSIIIAPMESPELFHWILYYNPAPT